tara:strand:+ start:1742 stop:2848 length:1107 start_codon:yes stop_codon:yes gene_type:complete
MWNISYVCFCNTSGYGQAAQDYINALLLDKDIDLRVDPVANQIANPGISDKRFALLKQLSKKEVSAEHIQIFHCVPTLQFKFKKLAKTIGFATFETFDPPDTGQLSWISILNNNDAVIVPSLFNYEVFAHTRLKKPIFYIPHSINTDIYHTDVKPSREFERFTFLFCGAWKLRKGFPQLLEAFFSEFDINDNVQLLIKTDKTSDAKSQIKQLKNNLGYKKKETAPILFEDKIFNENKLPGFFKSVDCLISPHLGEGFGLPGLQSMAVGTPIIITNFSGSKDYANEDTATLIQPRGFMMHECMDHYPQFRKAKWPFVAVKDIKDKMRFVMENYDKCLEKAKVGYGFVRDNFNYQRINVLFREMLSSVYG